MNFVGGKETVKPEDVSKRMKEMMRNYNANSDVTVNDVIAMHGEFEYIHPFQNGNGRVGRLIVLKECLHHGIVPFIIEDSKKLFYYRGLKNWKKEKGSLIDTFLDGQNTIILLLDQLGIPH
jgi:DNA phosphorothioation-dependent restriction protein DptG